MLRHVCIVERRGERTRRKSTPRREVSGPFGAGSQVRLGRRRAHAPSALQERGRAGSHVVDETESLDGDEPRLRLLGREICL
eukprot:6192016-Pleurochrysis_carterae.AAC.1